MSLAITLLLPAYLAFVIAGLGHRMAGWPIRLSRAAEIPWLERLCLGALCSVVLLALLGLAVVAVPYPVRSPLARSALVLVGLASGLCMVQGEWRALRSAAHTERIFALGFLALCALSIALALFPARLPATLIDGPYVAKHDLLGVRVQYTTGNMPTDNAIPHVVSEYLLKDISFRRERPLMPGQEVTNRPILAGVVVALFRAATYMPERQQGPLPRFTYVGTQWPDFSVLMRHEPGYRVSQAVGVALNALLLLAAGAVGCRRSAITAGAALAAVALYLSSPYLLFETYFTWPKALAGFFVLVAWLAAIHWRVPAIAGAALGLAYLSHPYAIAFFGAYLLWYIWVGWKDADSRVLGKGRSIATLLGSFLLAFAVVTAPWFGWKQWLAIPTDLVTQNLVIPGQGVADFLWIRVANTLNTVLPVHLLGYPFDLARIVIASAVNMNGALGLVIVAVLVHQAQVERVTPAAALMWAIPALALVCVFSNPSLPALHGLQPLIAVLVVLAAVHLRAWVGAGRAALAATSQVLVHAIVLALYYMSLR